MDYSEIVLKGVLDENTRNFLEKYFLREYKIAKRDQFFEANEFFSGCLKVVKAWEELLKREEFIYCKECIYTKNRIKDGTFSVNALEGKTFEESKNELIEFYESEVTKALNHEAFNERITIPLYLSTKEGRISYNLDYYNLLRIKDSIKKAYRETLVEEDLLPYVESLLSHIERLPSRLQTNLTNEQRAKLFTELIKGEFISSNTDPDCFNWAIGATNETEPKQPGQWQPIVWKQAKQLLRELLEAIKSDEIIKAEMERITPALFSSKGKVMEKLPKNKVTETQLHKRLKKIIADILKD
jgi:hypothetical protein